MQALSHFAGRIKTGFFKRDCVYVLFYVSSLVIYYADCTEVKAEKQRIKAQMTQQNIRWVDQRLYMEKAFYQHEEAIARLDGETAEKKDSRNLRILYRDIVKMKYTCAKEDSDGELNGVCLGRLVLYTKHDRICVLHRLEENAPQNEVLHGIFKAHALC